MATMQGNNGENEEKMMDEYLKAKGLYRRKIAKDGSCLFRAVAEQVLHNQGLHTKVRAECVKYLRQNRELYESFIEGDFEEYLQRLQDPQSWVGQVEISALAVLYKHDFIIYQYPGEPPVNITENGYPQKVQLCFLNGSHYDSVYAASYVKNAAVCQSILYELLYDRVCGVDRNVLSASMRRWKPKDEGAGVDECKASEDSDLDEGEDFWSSETAGKTTSVNNRPPCKGRGRGQARGGGHVSLPRDAQESLNPNVFRNVEYDVWMRSKKAQQRRDFYMAAGMQYTAGDKCQVQLNNAGRYYSAYIQDVTSDDGPVTVFIEELGEKHTVPLWNLRTPSEESWSTVTEKGKRHSSVTNGHGQANEWETRSGKKPARSVSAPYAAQANAGSGPGNRVHKQLSWPPQAPAETQSQGKSVGTRKSDQGTGALGVSPEEEEELLVLELLHKDENNFPSLESSAQAAATGELGRRAERKSPRKKSDAETKEQAQKPEQKADKGKPAKKGSLLQDQRISPPIKEKSSTSPSSTSPSVNSPAPSAPKAAKATPTAPSPARTTPAQPQTIPVPSVPPQTSAESTARSPPTLSAAPATSGSAQTSMARPQTVPHTSAAQSQVAATGAPTPQNTPTQSQTAPRAMKSASTMRSSSLTPNPSPQIAPALHSEVSATVTPLPNPSLSQDAPLPIATIAQITTVHLTSPAPTSGTTPVAGITTLPSPASSQTAPLTTPALSQTTSSTPPDPGLIPASSQTAPETTPALVITPTAAPTPSSSHTMPSASVSYHDVPPQTVPSPAEVAGASRTPPAQVSLSAHTSTAHAQHSITPPAQVNMSATPAPQLPSPLIPFHPGLATIPMMPPYHPYMTPSPTSAPMLTPPAAISSAPTPPFSHSSEPRSFEPAASPVAGVGPPAVPDGLSHGLLPHPQHPFSIPLSHLYQDPLYPGFPQGDEDEPIQPPPMSFQRNGKDLPKDINVLRFFFNLGVKAFTNVMVLPFTYLAPLNQAYQMSKVPPPVSSSSPYTLSWQLDNQPSMLHMSSGPNHSHVRPPMAAGGPVGHYEVRSVVPGPPPVEVGGYTGHSHSMPVHMPPQPWSVAPCPNVYAGCYSTSPMTQYPTPPVPPQTFAVGPQRPPGPPTQHRGIDVPIATERGEGDGQWLSAPQVDKTRFPEGQLQLRGRDKPAVVPVPVDLQHRGGASPVVQATPVGSTPNEESEPSLLANENETGDNFTGFQARASVGLVAHVQPGCTADEWDLEEAEHGEADLRSGRSYYSRSFRAGGRRGQEDRGGFRGRGSRGPRDHGGRNRPANQPFSSRGYVRGRGRGYSQHSNPREVGYGGGHFAPAAKI